MQTFSCLVIFAVITLAHSIPLEIFEDNNGQQFYLVHINRHKRDTSFDVEKQSHGGTRVTVGHEGYLDLGKSNNQLTVGGFASRQYGPKGPTTLGGTVGLKNEITGTKVSASFAQTPPYGTDVSLQAEKILFKERGATLQATVGANQHFGGPYGSGRADPSVGLEFNYSPKGGSPLEFLKCLLTGKSDNAC